MTISTEYFKADLDWIYSKSHNLLYEFRGAKILIVGASGFIGSWLLLFFRFLQTNHGFNCKITAIRYSKSTHIIEELNGQEICWIYGDIGELKLQDNNFTHIFFCATPSQLRTGMNSESRIIKSTVNGTKNLLEILKRQKTAPKYFNLSSGAVYFLNEKANSPYREFMAVKPDGNRRSINVYAKAKWESEEIIRQGTALGHVWGINLRVFSLSGPMLPLDQHFAFGNFLLDVKREKSIQISGNPLTTRSYLYIAELIYWIFVINIKMPLLPINVGGFHEISMIQLAEKINSILNGRGITVNDSIQDSNCYVPNMELFKKILEVQQSILIEQQIDQHFRWIKETGLSTQT